MEKIKRFEVEKLKKIQIFTGAQLKYIAFLSMLIDHVNNAIVTPLLDGGGFLLYLSNIFSILGRIAFPIFVFFIVEGFFKTKDRRKYLLTLMLFGVISEVPFDMFTSKTFFNLYWNNMMFTLALCLVTIWIIDIIKRKITNKALWYITSIIIVILFCLVAMGLSLDYDYHAILAAYIFYIFYDKPLIGAGLGYLSIIKELYSILGFAMTIGYNGKRGRQYKYLNYLFYPVHILILGILRFYFNI
ncbi:TraX family protein [Lachnoanaerobaculum umeaense]|uniref:Conjugal transfer protein TraX n=1 Tax=Lachnoanaerobaculum umeaense TaxID=617123 RepID=A0A385Q1W6_9FIRM|nr:TraX family protein [Lachnoanaerobaculum umeaense]AYA99739.1 conjugal transfer protein TraX [Lachnoanaerobaculum umeaense]PZW97740.1 TraX protein [Lachnoanaerobaculum umeaense]